jgi:hypothetical protein
MTRPKAQNKNKQRIRSLFGVVRIGSTESNPASHPTLANIKAGPLPSTQREDGGISGGAIFNARKNVIFLYFSSSVS